MNKYNENIYKQIIKNSSIIYMDEIIEDLRRKVQKLYFLLIDYTRLTRPKLFESIKILTEEEESERQGILTEIIGTVEEINIAIRDIRELSKKSNNLKYTDIEVANSSLEDIVATSFGVMSKCRRIGFEDKIISMGYDGIKGMLDTLNYHIQEYNYIHEEKLLCVGSLYRRFQNKTPKDWNPEWDKSEIRK